MTTTTQEIASGYKQTEVGVIPADWDFKPLREISILKGRIGWQGLKQSEFTMNPNEPYLITGMNFKDGAIRWDEVYHVSLVRYEVAKDIQLKPDDVLMTKDGTIGKLLFVNAIPYPGKASLNSHLLVFRPLRNAYDPKYLYYQLASKKFRDYIELHKSGSTFFGLSQQAVSGFCLLLPPRMSEQTAIANALSATDILIEKMEKLIKKKKNIKQGAMQELLTGKRRLPGFSGKWKTANLGKVAEFERGQCLSKADLNEEGSYKCIHYGQLFTEYKELIREIKSKTNMNINCFYSTANDVLMPTSDVTPRGLATASCIKESGIILGGGILVIKLHPGYDGLYLSYFITQNKNAVLKFVKGSTVFHLYASDLSNLEVIFPEFEEQKAISQILTEMEDEIEKLESQLTKYQNIKQGMMQTLLTGKIRLI